MNKELFLNELNILLKSHDITLQCPIKIKDGYVPLAITNEIKVAVPGTALNTAVTDRSGLFLVRESE